ncbi:MAG: NAD(P)/FAD-dependent oxidoreductase [Haloferacaceae archaeon]
MEQIVVLGAGVGGTMTANFLRRKLDRSEAEITVVDRSTTHVYQPSFYLLPFHYMEPEDQTRDVRESFQDGVAFVEDEVTAVDPDAQTVELAGAEDALGYDYLVVATGHRTDESAVPGMKAGWEETDSVYPFYNFEAAMGLREALPAFDGGTFLVTIPDTPIKCAGAPLKMSMLAEDYFERQGIRDDVEVIMTRNADSIFGVEPYKSKLEEIWEERDIQAKLHFSVAEVDYENQIVRSADGEEIEYDLYAPVSPQFGVEAITEHSPLTEGDEENGQQYVTVDDYTLQHTEYDNVFALGDCDDTPKSRTAAAARKQSHVVAKNLAAVIEDRPMRAAYSGYAACPLLTEKGKAMVAEFDYEESISAPVNSRMNWIMDINVLPAIYWNSWLRGYDPLP